MAPNPSHVINGVGLLKVVGQVMHHTYHTTATFQGYLLNWPTSQEETKLYLTEKSQNFLESALQAI